MGSRRPIFHFHRFFGSKMVQKVKHFVEVKKTVHIFYQQPSLKSFKSSTISPHNLQNFFNQVIIRNPMTQKLILHQVHDFTTIQPICWYIRNFPWTFLSESVTLILIFGKFVMPSPLEWRLSNWLWKIIVQEYGSLQYNKLERIATTYSSVVVQTILWYVQKDPQTELPKSLTIFLIFRRATIPFPLEWRGSNWLWKITL